MPGCASKQNVLELTTIRYLKSVQLNTKGQIKLKADLGAVDSPKKRTNEFGLFIFWENYSTPKLLRVLSDL